MVQGMESDFSWDSSADRYIEVYHTALGSVNSKAAPHNESGYCLKSRTGRGSVTQGKQ